MQSILASRLKEVTLDLRRMEKEHFLKVQEVHGGTSSREKSVALSGDDMLLEMDEDEDQFQSKEIALLAKSINDLAVLFKDLSDLVVEQGTILDRVDFNIEQASTHTQKAVVHIAKTLQIEKSTRARGCIIFLAVSIFVFSLLLTLKWA